MKKKLFKKETPEAREFYKPMRCVGGFILTFTVLSSILVSLSSSITLLINYAVADYRLSQTLSTFISTSVMVYGYYLGYRIFFKKYVGQIWDKQLPKKKEILPICLHILAGFFAIRGVWHIYEQLSLSLGIDILVDYSMETYLDPASIFYTCLLAPIAEELVFRGWIIKLLKGYGKYFALVISAIFFGLFHGTYPQSIPAIFIGLVLGYMAILFDSLVPCIILHMANNIYSTIITYTHLDFYGYIVMIAFVIYFGLMFLINIKKIPLKTLGLRIKTVWHSRASVVFIILYIVIIVIDMTNYIL